MELVYLWVKEYKNIKDEGFNFSPRFTCRYDDVTKKLTIDEKKEHVTVFPKNINVTAIVGENGSGKSSVLKIINSIFEDRYPETNYVLIIHDNTLSYIANFDVVTTLEKYSQHSLVHYLYLANEQTIKNNFYSENFEHFQHRILLNENMIANMLCDKYISSIEFHLTSFMYIPHKIEVKPILKDVINDIISNQQFSYPSFLDKDLTDKEEDKQYKEIRNHQYAKEDNLNHLFYESITDEYHKFLILWYIREYGYDDDDYLLEDKLHLINEFKNHDSFLSENEFLKYFQEKTIETNSFTTKSKKIYFQYYKDYFEFDFIDEKERRYQDLSHGEQTIFGQLLNMYYYLQLSEKPTFFLLDEPDLALHPQWQKRYINEINNTLSKVKKNIYFLITSHSPFILSDLPKENVIFLENGKQVDVNIDTFGANIHTLLSHGFFMKNGLMGEFAKSKIEDVINYLNDKESTIKTNDEAQNLLNIIGEPVIKNQLQKMLDSKRLSKVDEIDKIKADMEKLAKRLEELEND